MAVSLLLLLLIFFFLSLMEFGKGKIISFASRDYILLFFFLTFRINDYSFSKK